MIDAKEAQKIRDRSGKFSFDERYPSVVKYVEDEIRDAAMAGYSRVVLEFGGLLLADPEMKMFDLAEFLRSKGYFIKILDDSREDDGLLIISW